MLMLSLIAAASLGAAAQADDDWDFTADPAKDVAEASIRYEGGVSLSVRCQAGEITALLGGMPASPDTEREFVATLADGASVPTTWLPVTGSPILRTPNARTVRFLKGGGRLTLQSAPGEPQPARLTFDLPSQSANLDRVLTACNYPTVDDRDGRVFEDSDILNDLRLEMPMSALRGRPSLVVDLSCIVSAGRLTECRSDHQTPNDPTAGDVVARSVNGKRLRHPDPAAEGKAINFSMVGQTVRR